jgi:hypothetical protein
MLGILVEHKNMATMGIVWRNPNQVRHNRRRHSLECAGEHTLYILQEFVQEGALGHWATISGLEVVLGGRAA